MNNTDSKGSPFWGKTPLVQEDDIFSELGEKRGSTLFLGKYSLTEVMAVLGKKSFFNESRKRDLWPLRYELDSSEFPLQRLRIYYRERKPASVIVDLKIRIGLYWPKDRIVLGHCFSDCRCLILEWLTLQNPLLTFTPRRPALPGQLSPGLGLGNKVVDVFVYLARLSHLDAILAFPAYFHNAVLFSRYFRFLNPAKEAEVLAIRKSLAKIPLKQLAWIVHLGCLKKAGGGVYEWNSEEQVHSLNKSLKDYFGSRAYKEAVRLGLKSMSFEVDWETYERKMKASPEGQT